jgi:hypothetical protein
MTRTARVHTVPKPVTAPAIRGQGRTGAGLGVAMAVADPLPDRDPGMPWRLVTLAISIPVGWVLSLRRSVDDGEPTTVALRAPMVGELVVVRSRVAPGVRGGRTRAGECAGLALVQTVLRCGSRTGQSRFCPKLDHREREQRRREPSACAHEAVDHH